MARPESYPVDRVCWRSVEGRGLEFVRRGPDRAWFWRLSGEAPWRDERAFAQWLVKDTLTEAENQHKYLSELNKLQEEM